MISWESWMQPGLSSTPSMLQELCNLQAQASNLLPILLPGNVSADSHNSLASDWCSSDSADVKHPYIAAACAGIVAMALWIVEMSIVTHEPVILVCWGVIAAFWVCCRHTWLDHSMLVLPLKSQGPCISAGTVAAASAVPVAAALQKQGSGL